MTHTHTTNAYHGDADFKRRCVEEAQPSDDEGAEVLRLFDELAQFIVEGEEEQFNRIRRYIERQRTQVPEAVRRLPEKWLQEYRDSAGEMTLTRAVSLIIARHGGLRKTSKATGVDLGYLSRLKSGHRTAPSEETLSALGLERRASYRLRRRGNRRPQT